MHAHRENGQKVFINEKKSISISKIVHMGINFKMCHDTHFAIKRYRNNHVVKYYGMKKEFH